MFLTFTCLFAVAAAAPATYDQRQDGEFNAQVDVQNVVFLLALPKKIPTSLFDIFSKNHKPVDKESGLMERSDIRLMEAFVEPSEPYRVEIGSERAAGDGRAVEVVIAGRQRTEADLQEQDELKLLGATENCGPDRVRDSTTLMCKDKNAPENNVEAKPESSEKESPVDLKPTPEVVPS